MLTNTLLDRRAFLKKAATGGAVLVVGFHLPPGAAAKDSAEEQEKKTPNPLNAWVPSLPIITSLSSSANPKWARAS